MPSDSHLKRQLIRYRDLLANFSRRNRELYYKESKASSINLSKLPFTSSQLRSDSSSTFTPLRMLSSEFEKFIKGEDIDLHRHLLIDDATERESIQKLTRKIDKIRLSDDKHQREYGISGAWLLGPFLCWRASAQAPMADLLISPLLKVPIDLKKNKKQHFILHTEDESFSLNPSLMLMLKQTFGFVVPEEKKFDTVEEAVSYLTVSFAKLDKQIIQASADIDDIPSVPPRTKIIRNELGEEIGRKPIVLEEELSAKDLAIYQSVTATTFLLIDVVYLDQLNASRTVLINDYETILDQAADHPIISELFNGTPLADEPPLDRSKLRELDAYREKDNHFVVNIDSTQHRAIDRATRSRAIVIQGPPGTGKSQTITNLIADYIAKGKRILFVSEKRPALDVVFNRLKSANIDSQAVLIHSSELNKSQLYQSFLQLAKSEPCQTGDREWQATTELLDRVKTEINSYAEAIKAEHLPSELTVSDILLLASQADQSLFDPAIKDIFGHLTYERLQALVSEIEGIRSVLSRLPDFRRSPWIARKAKTLNSASLLHSLGTLRDSLIDMSSSVSRLESEFKEATGSNCDKTSAEALISFKNTHHDANKVSEEFSGLWTCVTQGDIALTEVTTKIQNLVAELERTYKGFSSIEPDTDPSTVMQLEEYYKTPRGITDLFSGVYWKNRSLRKSICSNWDGTHLKFQQHREYISAYRDLSELLKKVGRMQSSEYVDLTSIRDRANKTIATAENLRRFLVDSAKLLPLKLHDQATRSYQGYLQTLKDIQVSVVTWSSICNIQLEAIERWHSLSLYLEVIPSIPNDLLKAVDTIRNLIEAITDLDILDQADILIANTSAAFNIPNLKDTLVSKLGSADTDWKATICSSVLNGWAEDVVAQHLPLRSYSREQLVNWIERFQNLETKHRETARQAVHNAFARRWTTSSDQSGIPLLRNEASKQRRVLSPREIMEKGALETMMQLKPCWLMSPLSISQMLPLTNGLFDVIIFDEASQVRVEDAIPSIFRAKSMIVVGDNKQMPPTSFFSSSTDDDDDGDEEPISDSVLDLATNAYPSVLLEWHYRSRSEALIAFSNRAFYGGRLIAAPNPATLTSSRAIKYIEVENAYFTSKSGNSVEAKAVIDQLVDLISENPNRSYGVIAMGQSQAIALEEALEQRRDSDSKARELLDKSMNFKDGDADAGLFIKNLENVQGDERDVILMSVGYAPSGPGAKLRQNFGPLSSKGGGRRLNVAITRAKSEMYVFTSFSPSAIPTDDEMFNHNMDRCTFGRYLKYARAVSDGQNELAVSILDSFGMGGVITNRKSSRFALDVKRRLEERGYNVSAEIGSSGFYIDLGVHHPVLHSNYILGIECDGAVFHCTPYARDRDKIREDLLVSRGWRIARVWSQDWSRNWMAELDRLECEIKRIIALAGNESKVSGY